MDHIKELIQGDQNHEHVHQKFVKYSKGAFSGPTLSIKKTGDNLKINGSYDYADAVAGVILKNSPGTIKAAGTIYSRTEIKTPYSTKAKKKLGVCIIEIKAEADASALKTLYEQSKDATFLIDIEASGAKMKAKKKPPKPGSGSDDQFFSATIPGTMIGAVMTDLFFDAQKKDFKEAKISHAYQINEIVIPEEYKKDAAKARLMAKRKGTLKRKVEIDGVATETEKALLV
jgi:hypothetical protein